MLQNEEIIWTDKVMYLYDLKDTDIPYINAMPTLCINALL